MLIQGESGTGKELVARALHQKSPRGAEPFVPVNCGAIPEGLIESAIEAMREGAFHYIPKPFKNEEVLLTIRKGLEQRRLATENRSLRQQLRQRFGFDNILGKSKPMQQVFELIQLSAPAKSNILILGESGTGKELVAKAIHHHSRRSAGAFITVNSGSMPAESPTIWARPRSSGTTLALPRARVRVALAMTRLSSSCSKGLVM